LKEMRRERTPGALDAMSEQADASKIVRTLSLLIRLPGLSGISPLLRTAEHAGSIISSLV